MPVIGNGVLAEAPCVAFEVVVEEVGLGAVLAVGNMIVNGRRIFFQVATFLNCGISNNG